MAASRPIIVIKKSAGHGGHHGGAWKVAYADFVTAMMALFIVLWLLNSSKQVQVAVGGYFKDPTGTAKMVGSDKSGSGDNFIVNKENMSKLKDELQNAVKKTAMFEKLKNQIEMTITAEGLRIELMETEKGAFFPSSVSEPSEDGKQILGMLAEQLGGIPNAISIEGHTDSKPYAGNGVYGNWELSADRANAARRVMQQHGLAPRQVQQIRGYGDQQLRKPAEPQDASNRRISVIVHYQVQAGKEGDKAEAKTADAKEGHAAAAEAGTHESAKHEESKH